MPLPPRFEAVPYGGLSGSASRSNGNGRFSADSALERQGMPRGKTARELTIGRKLRELREQRRLTQQEMAGKAGVPRTYISRIENARLLPGPVMLQRIADALSVAILDLLPQAKASGALETEDEHFWNTFVGYFSRLATADMAYVVSHARQLAEQDKTYAPVPALAVR